MTVYFIGAGPGDPELITLKARRLIQTCPVCLYAGSLVPEAVIQEAPPDARIIDSAGLHLDEIIAEITSAYQAGKDVARVHSGDPSLYGATSEQIRRLKALGIDYKIIPGVPAYAAAAAALGQELTIPEVCQTVILTRTAMKSTNMPVGEDLETLAQSNATLAIHLSIRNLPHIERSLTPFYGEDCPVIVAYRIGWPDQHFIYATLKTIRAKARKAKITRTALIFVGHVFAQAHDFPDSVLYNAEVPHILRPVKSAK